MTKNSLALLLAGVSLGVSLATFVWRIIYDIYVDAPRLDVTFRAMVIAGYQSGPADVYVVAATNKGRRPTTVTSLWLCFGRPRRWWWRLLRFVMSKERRKKFFAGAIMMPDSSWASYNTKLPLRLESGAQAFVNYSRDAVYENLKEHPYRFMYGTAGATLGGGNSRAMRVASPTTEEHSDA